MPAEQQAQQKPGSKQTVEDRIDIEGLNIRGVNQAEDEIRPELGQFTSLENWVPEKIYAIHKKRGVGSFTSADAFLRIFQETGFAILQESGSALLLE